MISVLLCDAYVLPTADSWILRNPIACLLKYSLQLMTSGKYHDEILNNLLEMFLELPAVIFVGIFPYREMYLIPRTFDQAYTLPQYRDFEVLFIETFQTLQSRKIHHAKVNLGSSQVDLYSILKLYVSASYC